MTKFSLAFLSLLLLSVLNTCARTAPLPEQKMVYLPLRALKRQSQNAALSAALQKNACDYFIVSNISTGAGTRSVRKYGLLVAVTAWGQSFSSTNLPPKLDPKTKSGERLTVVLQRTGKAGKMRAKYEDIVYERGEVKIKFSGTMIMSMPE